MERRKFFQLSIALSLSALGLAACGRGEALRVGIHPWPGYEPLMLAQHFGWLGESVQLREGDNASDSIAGLQDGTLSAACLTLDEVLAVRAGGLPLTVVLVLNESVGADAVLARPEIDRPAGLAGRRIAVEQGAVGGLVLHKLLEDGGLSRADVELIDVPPSEQLPLWQSGAIDAAISYPPFSKFLLREGAQVLFDSRAFPQTIFDVLAVRSDRLRPDGAALRTLIAGHLRALEHFRASREDALRRIGGWRNLSFEEVEASFHGLHLPGQAENYRLLAAQGALVEAARLIDRLLAGDAAMLSARAFDGLVSAAFLPTER